MWPFEKPFSMVKGVTLLIGLCAVLQLLPFHVNVADRIGMDETCDVGGKKIL